MTPPLLDHAAIAARIPHAGRMCLLDRVIAWDEDGIVCESDGHRTDDRDRRRDGPHPLVRDGALPATAAIEYAAQAMALHGALIGERAATAAGAAVDEPACWSGCDVDPPAGSSPACARFGSAAAGSPRRDRA